MAKEDDVEIGNWSVSRIFSPIKGAFREKDFGMLEDVLVIREENLRAEIKKLSEENMVLKRDLGRKDKEIIALRREKCDIEVSKAEALAKAKVNQDILKLKYEALNTKVMICEEETKLLANSEAFGGSRIVEADDNEEKMEKVAEKVIDAIKKAGFDVGSGPYGKLMSKESNVAHEAKRNQEKVKKTEEKVIDAIKKAGFDVGSDPYGKLTSKESNGAHEAKRNQEKVKKTEEKVVDAIKKAGFDVGSGPYGKLMSKESNGAHEAKRNQEKVKKTEEKVIKAELVEESNGAYEAKRNQENMEKVKEKVIKAELVEETKELKAPNDVIEIESDDDDDDWVPIAAQNVKEKVGETVPDNKMLKRKRPSGGYMVESSDEEHINGDTSSGKDKMKLQTPTRKPENAVSSAKPGSESARQREEKVVSEQRYDDIHSGNFYLGSDSSDSSESDSDDDDDDFDNIDKILSSQAI